MSADFSQPRIKTVSQVTKEIKSLFEQRYQFVRITGEISNLRKPHSGHYYFNLKDENAQIRAVLFKNQSMYLGETLTDGQQVICDGRITIYEPRGEYQIIVDTVDFCGSGHLQIAFEQLKAKLLKEGLFDQSSKKKLPQYIKKIILITSPGGAAVHDFLSVCYRRNGDLSIQILPVRVQGEGSADDIVSALQLAEELVPDVVVLCRGGGSIEDLWSFNEERVARAIYRSSIPVVSAIGHEVDITIADYCADFRCATPTSAAELLVPQPVELKNTIARMVQRIARSMLWRLESVRFRLDSANRLLSTYENVFHTKTIRLDTLKTRLIEMMFQLLRDKGFLLQNRVAALEQLSPQSAVSLHQVRLDYCLMRLRKGIEKQLDKKLSRFVETAAVLDSLSPLATLSRGYSIVTKPLSGEIITDEDQVGDKETVNVRLHKGMLTCRVIKNL